MAGRYQLPLGGPEFCEEQSVSDPRIGFFEFMGRRYPKAQHRFTLNEAPFTAIAGIWREGKGGAPPAFNADNGARA